MAHLRKRAVVIDPEYADRIAQTVYSIDESPIRGDADFRGENRAYKSWRKARDLMQLR